MKQFHKVVGVPLIQHESVNFQISNPHDEYIVVHYTSRSRLRHFCLGEESPPVRKAVVLRAVASVLMNVKWGVTQVNSQVETCY